MGKLAEIPLLFYWCCDDDFAFDFSKPFVQGQWLWAADRAIVVRQPVEDFDADLCLRIMEKRGVFPDMKIIWDSCKDITRTPTELAGEFIPCTECNGREFIECENCLGARYDYGDDDVKVGDSVLSGYYAGLLRRAGIRWVGVGAAYDPVSFSLDRIEGFLIPKMKGEVADA